MNVGEALRTSVSEIRANKLRSALSFSALAVGAASILYTFAQIHGMKKAAREAIELQGPGRMFIEGKRGYVSKGLSRGLTLEDYEAIRKAIPNLYMIFPKLFNRDRSTLNFNGRLIEGFEVMGTIPEWSKRDWIYTVRGRLINDWDVRTAARVCDVVEPGGWYKKPFWADDWKESKFDTFVRHQDLLGHQILLNDHYYRVIGVLKEPPQDLDPRWFRQRPVQVLLPITTMIQYFKQPQDSRASPSVIDGIHLDTGNERTVPIVKRQIEQLLKRLHNGEEDTEIYDGRQQIEEELTELGRYLTASAVLGAVALFAGGVGIMNVTLAALFSRVKEIGIRRALGASRVDILAQFLTEAGLLGFVGGIAGLALGKIGLVYLAENQQHNLAFVTWYHYAEVIAICVGSACLFSLYPAWKASGLDPVEALRSE